MKRIKRLPLLQKLFILCLIFSNVPIFSQNIISRDPIDYIGGEVASECVTDPTSPECVIVLPPAYADSNYYFQIPLKSGINRSDIAFIFTQIGLCSEGSITFTNDGAIEMNFMSICKPQEEINYIEIDLDVVNNENGGSDIQKYRLPILRNPLKVVLVLDISSSMGLTVPGGTDTRLNVLKKSVNLFTTKFEKYYQEGDSISVIYFSKDTIMPDAPIDSNFIAITPEDFTPTNLKSSEIINADMQNRTLQDSAAMGNALLLAKYKLENSDASKIVLLFTDGHQDVKPLINKFGNKLTNGEFLNETPCDQIDNVLYFTIGMGNITSLPEILSEIAIANGGLMLNTSTGDDEGDFYNFFQNQFNDLLNGKGQPVDTRIVDLIPFDDTLNVTVSTELTIMLNEAVYTNSGFIKIKRSKDDTDFELIDVTSGQVSGSGTSNITINPSNNFESYTDYYILIDETAFKNVENENYSGINSKTFWNFKTKDIISPEVSISTLERNPTNSNPFEIGIEFSEEISGFSVDEISVINGSASNLSTSNDTIFTANINPASDGLITIHVNSNVANDNAENPNTESNTLEITFDATQPFASLNSDNDTTTSAQFSTYINFSERIIGFNSTEINVSNGSVNSLSTSDSIDYVAIITATSQGEIDINMNENQVRDSAGNFNTAADELTILYSIPTNNDVLKEKGILIYSNNGYVIIEFLNPKTLSFASGCIEIYSINGSLIKKENIVKNSIFKTYVNNIQEIYLVKLKLDNQIYFSKILN